ncbi:PQ-loop repeat-containing protein [Aspergillus stella-maris]|uniref:PQ-loop repeat-containing protein n=1 Tax=Aspergillus stella-maris TaxID=1810926 RepID=UPI003CCD5B2C
MARPECPDRIRIILLVLTAFSFLPQLIRLWWRKNTTGFSTGHVLLNLFAATEQLTIDLFLMVVAPEAASGEFTHEPLSTGDWLNLAQIGTAWVGFNILFITCLSLQPAGTSIKGYIKAYSLYILISLLPQLIDISGPTPSTKPYPRDTLLEFFIVTHTLFLKPLTTFLILISALCQTGPIWRFPGKRGKETSLSLTGLVVQFVVFSCVGVSWIYRVVEFKRLGEPWVSVEWDWYWSVGWPVVDGVGFGGVQGVLAWCVLFNRAQAWIEGRKGRKGVGDEDEGTPGEREPLLGEREA